MDVVAPLRHSLQRLAQLPAAQVALFPSLVVLGEELARGFDDALRAFRASAPEASAAQLSSLQQLADHLSELSRSQSQAFWLEPIALAVDPHWQQVREMASAALAAFHWPVEAPERGGAAPGSEGRGLRGE